MLKIRLRRMGARNSAFYRVVVSDSRKRPGSSALEELGHYDPTKNPAQMVLDRERIESWVKKGARVSPTVRDLLHKTPGQTPDHAAAAAES